MYEKSAFVFWLTLVLYIITLSTVSYVGVYLTYIAIPIIVFSGLIMKFAKPKPKTQEVLDTVSLFKKEISQAKNELLDEVNTSLAQYNEKTELIRKKTEYLRAKKHHLELQKVEPEINLKDERNLSEKNVLKNATSNIKREIRDCDREINRIKRECERKVARKFRRKP